MTKSLAVVFSIPIFAILLVGYLYFDPLVLLVSFFLCLYLIAGPRLYVPNCIGLRVYLSLSILLSFLLILQAMGTTLYAYILLSAITLFFRFKGKYFSVNFFMQLIIITYLALSYFFLLVHLLGTETSLAPDFNNVLSAYSIIPYFFIFLITDRVRAFFYGSLINIFLLLSFSKTGWLIMAGNLLFTFFRINLKMKILLLIAISILIFLFHEEMIEAFTMKMTLSGFGESNTGHFYDRLEITTIVRDYLLNEASFFQLLFGYSFVFGKSTTLTAQFSNSGFFHSAFLEVVVTSGIVGLIVYTITQVIIARTVGMAFSGGKFIPFIYISFCLIIVNLTSSIFLRYYIFMIMPIICIEVIRLRRRRENPYE